MFVRVWIRTSRAHCVKIWTKLVTKCLSKSCYKEPEEIMKLLTRNALQTIWSCKWKPMIRPLIPIYSALSLAFGTKLVRKLHNEIFFLNAWMRRFSVNEIFLISLESKTFVNVLKELLCARNFTWILCFESLLACKVFSLLHYLLWTFRCVYQ